MESSHSEALKVVAPLAAISRRRLLRNTAIIAAGAALLSEAAASAPARAAAPQSGDQAAPAMPDRPAKPLRGVNLGNWLVLEKWIAPRVFEGVQAGDEHGFCAELGPKVARERLEKHWNSWITEADFA